MPIPVQYYGLNATDFFGRKIAWDECRMWCLDQHITFNYQGVYWFIIPLLVLLGTWIVYLMFIESKEEKPDFKPIIPYIAIFIMLAMFMTWFVLQLKGLTQ